MHRRAQARLVWGGDGHHGVRHSGRHDHRRRVELAPDHPAARVPSLAPNHQLRREAALRGVALPHHARFSPQGDHGLRDAHDRSDRAALRAIRAGLTVRAGWPQRRTRRRRRSGAPIPGNGVGGGVPRRVHRGRRDEASRV